MSRSAAASAQLAGEAWFSGTIALIEHPFEAVAARLPRGVALDGARLDGMTTLVLIFGQQRHGAGIRGGLPLPIDQAFFEFGVIAPRVKLDGAAGEKAFVLCMGSSYPAVVAVGNREYGFNKTLTTARVEDRRFTMFGDDGRLWFCADSAPLGKPRRLRAIGSRAAEETRGLAHRAVLGRRTEGTLVEARFDWDFDCALVRSARAQLDIDPALALASQALSIEVAESEAIAVDSMAWRLSWPRVVSAYGGDRRP